MEYMLKNKTKALLILFISLVLLSTAATYYKTLILEDFYIENDLEEEYVDEAI